MRRVINIVCLAVMGAGIILMAGAISYVNAKSEEDQAVSKKPMREYYTIQVSSYKDVEGAETDFSSLLKIQEPGNLDKLRIELVGTYYTVRIGGFEGKPPVRKLLSQVKKQFPKAILLSAFIKEFRIIKMHKPILEKDVSLVVEVADSQVEDETATDVLQSEEEAQERDRAAELPKEPVRRQIEIISVSRPEVPVSNIEIEKAMPIAVDAESNIKPEKSAVEEEGGTFIPEEGQTPVPAKEEVVIDTEMAEAVTESCTTAECHVGIKETAYKHAPVEESQCLACHKRTAEVHPGEQTGFVLVKQGAALCNKCHAAVDKKKVVHDPVLEGECLACHQPHGASEKYLLEVGENQTTLCLTCHEDSNLTQKVGHGPVDLGICSYCHDPHAAENEKLLRENTEDICISCHLDFGREMLQADFLHPAMQERSCSGCHFSHSSEYPSLLKQKDEKLCFECHQEIESRFASKNQHDALYTDKGCENCHLVHFSDYEHLLYNYEEQVCFDCHGQDDSSRSKPLRNIKKEMEGKEIKHGNAEIHCTSCHNPHGTDYSKLLTSSYPSDFYSPYKPDTYSFCFECHDGGLLQASQATDQTGFRNGGQNLHFLHVVREQKGRTCQACHQSHASDGPKLISTEGSAFGSWRIPLRFTMSETGGSCTPGCHRSVKYDRELPVDYNK